MPRRQFAAVAGPNGHIYGFGGQQKAGRFADAVFLDSVVATSEPVTD
ncbi:hypothetical protein [Roseovarius litorisediminis]|nr:hypothetical protein [Roseovarius litorisediminis]